MKRPSFADAEYKLRKKVTPRDEFLQKMDKAIPWNYLVALIKPFYPEGKRGRPVQGIEKMLRMYLLQCWYNLSDEAVEDSIYDSYAFREFMKINFLDEQVPDATTLLRFRHLLEEHEMGKQIFSAIKRVLEETGCIMRGGSIVDATIIQAPASTKNATKSRDPEMKSTKKGNQHYFGMKAHIGVDAGSGYVHTLLFTAANVHDAVMASQLIRKDDHTLYGDSGYLGIQERQEIKNDEHLSKIDFRINRRPSTVKKADGNLGFEKQIEKRKSSVRCKVEHPFLLVKRYFGYAKTRYKGLAKNAHRLYTLFASANLLMSIRAGRRLITIG